MPIHKGALTESQSPSNEIGPDTKPLPSPTTTPVPDSEDSAPPFHRIGVGLGYRGREGSICKVMGRRETVACNAFEVWTSRGSELPPANNLAASRNLPLPTYADHTDQCCMSPWSTFSSCHWTSHTERPFNHAQVFAERGDGRMHRSGCNRYQSNVIFSPCPATIPTFSLLAKASAAPGLGRPAASHFFPRLSPTTLAFVVLGSEDLSSDSIGLPMMLAAMAAAPPSSTRCFPSLGGLSGRSEGSCRSLRSGLTCFFGPLPDRFVASAEAYCRQCAMSCLYDSN